MDEYLMEYKNIRTEEIREAIRLKSQKLRASQSPELEEEIVRLKAVTAINDAIVELAKQIVVEESALKWAVEMMNERPEEASKVSIPIEFEEPALWIRFQLSIELDIAPFTMMSALIVQNKNEEIKKRASTIAASKKVIEEINKDQEEPQIIFMYICDEFADIKFCMINDGEAWKFQINAHRCPFKKCAFTKDGEAKKVCDECKMLADAINVFLGILLHAERGEYQEERIIVSEHEPRTRSSKARPDTAAPTRTRIVSVDVEENKVYRRKEETEPGQKQRANWLTLHSEDEIEEEHKRARSHTRTYRDGRKVQVSQSKPRIYRHLRGISTVKHLRNKKYE